MTRDTVAEEPVIEDATAGESTAEEPASEAVAPEPARREAWTEAAERGLALLDEPPWDERAREVMLLMVRPPRASSSSQWADDSAMLALTPAFWLLLEARDARTLPEPWREALARHSLRRVREAGIELTVLTIEGYAALLEATTRRALEARWSVRHAAAIHDPLGRHEGFGLAAGRVPADALERITRPLYLQAYAALDALPLAVAGALVIAGEAAAAVTRLAWLLEEGAYPPAEWLPAAALETRLGRRLRPWLETLPQAGAGEAAALRSATQTAPTVLEELTTALRPHFADREWLQDPETYALRPPRDRG